MQLLRDMQTFTCNFPSDVNKYRPSPTVRKGCTLGEVAYYASETDVLLLMPLIYNLSRIPQNVMQLNNAAPHYPLVEETDPGFPFFN